MALEVFDIEQRSQVWREARLGVPTASEFQCLLAETKDRRGRKSYLYRLAGEIMTGIHEETYRNEAMDKGTEQEPQGLSIYETETGRKVTRVGFYKQFGAGMSPDGTIGDDGLVELKNATKPSVMLAYLDAGKFPSEHIAQCQGGLWITGRRWIDLCISCEHWPKIPALILRAERDVAKIAEIAREVKLFQDDLAALVAKIRGSA